MELRHIALEVHTVLREYIEVHDSVFGGSWLRKLLPIRGIFQRINFEHNAIRLISYEEILDRLISSVNECDNLLIDDLDLVMSLTNYIDALKLAFKKLRAICIALHVKAEGQAYPMSEYKRDVAEYRQLVSLYQKIGESLNSAMQ